MQHLAGLYWLIASTKDGKFDMPYGVLYIQKYAYANANNAGNTASIIDAVRKLEYYFYDNLPHNEDPCFDLAISPGFLGYSQNGMPDLIDLVTDGTTFTAPAFPQPIHGNIVRKMWIMRDMKRKLANTNTRVRDYVNTSLLTPRFLNENSLHNDVDTSEADHRKMMFFYTAPQGIINNIDDLIDYINSSRQFNPVHFVSVGSSNFSPSTMLTPTGSHDESDIIIFDNTKRNGTRASNMLLESYGSAIEEGALAIGEFNHIAPHFLETMFTDTLRAIQ